MTQIDAEMSAARTTDKKGRDRVRPIMSAASARPTGHAIRMVDPPPPAPGSKPSKTGDCRGQRSAPTGWRARESPQSRARTRRAHTPSVSSVLFPPPTYTLPPGEERHKTCIAHVLGVGRHRRTPLERPRPRCPPTTRMAKTLPRSPADRMRKASPTNAPGTMTQPAATASTNRSNPNQRTSTTAHRDSSETDRSPPVCRIPRPPLRRFQPASRLLRQAARGARGEWSRLRHCSDGIDNEHKRELHSRNAKGGHERDRRKLTSSCRCNDRLDRDAIVARKSG